MTDDRKQPCPTPPDLQGLVLRITNGRGVYGRYNERGEFISAKLRADELAEPPATHYCRRVAVDVR